MKEPRSWTVRSRETSFDHHLFRVETRSLEADDGDRREALVIDSCDWVNVIALTDKDEVVFIRQFRFGTGEITTEIPGGMVEPDETAAQAAARELEEETGYRAAHVEFLGAVDPNPAIQNNRCSLFLATGLTDLGAPAGDGDEEITVELVPYTEVTELVERGEIRHALVLCAFYRLLHRRP